MRYTERKSKGERERMRIKELALASCTPFNNFSSIYDKLSVSDLILA